MPWAQKHVQSDTGMTARQLRTGMGWMCADVHIDKTENGIRRRQSPFQLGFGGLTADEVGHCDYKKLGKLCTWMLVPLPAWNTREFQA